MTSLANVAAPLPRAKDADSAAAPFRIEILSELEAAQALWRGFEREAVATPFQRYDWVGAFWRAGGQPGEPRVVVVGDAGGRVQMLLPLAIERRHGLKIARFTGGKQASYH